VLERTQRLARWAGLKVGSQPQLFEARRSITFEEGKTAGMSGDKCEPPKTLARTPRRSGFPAGTKARRS
jgi:hypothetical protein